MNARTAYKLGVASGEEAAEYGDFTAAELADQDRFVEACHEICENKRQYADHPGYDFNRGANAETLWDSFEAGEAVGVRKGWRKRLRHDASGCGSLPPEKAGCSTTSSTNDVLEANRGHVEN